MGADTVAEQGNGRAPDHLPAGETGAAPTSAPPSPDMLALRGRLDRFGDILARGLDLAEAGLNLGLTLATTVGAAAQHKIVERLMGDPGAAPMGAVPMGAASPERPASPAGNPDFPTYGITNRLPLQPGSPVAISFSINNDSADAPKRVMLRAEGFAGTRPGGFLPLDSLRLLPDMASIAPLDFEKFVLIGTISPDAAPDTYQGSVLVESDASMSIPVWIVVQPVGA